MTDPKNETPSTPPPPPPPPKARAQASAPPPPPPPPPTAPTGNATTQQATAAVSSAVSDVRQRLMAGEQIVLVAAAIIVVVSYFIWEFLLDYRVLSSFSVVIAVLTILAIWVHRWGHYDFGPGYRIVLGALGVSLALFAVVSLLAWIRVGGNSVDFLHLIGRLIYWIAGIAAGYGAWLVFRTRGV